MNYIKLNKTDLVVSPICLGTVNFGTTLSAEESKAQLTKFVENGGNIVDTAHVYGNWDSKVDSISERIIGDWFEETGLRKKVILATKGAHPLWGHMDIPRVNKKDINHDLNESLEYLKTDYIDIYFLHRDDVNTPVSEIMECLDEARKAGMIRYYGCSNWTLPRIKEAQKYCEEHGLQGFTFNQLMWSLADINFYNLPDKTFILMDDETREYHKQTGMNAMAYMSIAKGYFERRASGEKLPASVVDVYENKTNDEIYNVAKEVVSEGMYSYMDLSYMYIMGEEAFCSIPLASFDNVEQLVVAINCLNKTIPKDIIKKFSSAKQYVYR